jgi:hypothetical protein
MIPVADSNPTDPQEPPIPSDPARSYAFTVILAGVDELTPALTDALYEAGCDDCTPHSVGPIVTLAFDREAGSLGEAIGSAVADVERAGYGVAKVEVARAGR